MLQKGAAAMAVVLAAWAAGCGGANPPAPAPDGGPDGAAEAGLRDGAPGDLPPGDLATDLASDRASDGVAGDVPAADLAADRADGAADRGADSGFDARPDSGPDAGTDRTPDAADLGPPALLTATARPDPEVVTMARVELEVPQEVNAIVIEYGENGAYGSATPRLRVEAGTTAVLPVLGLTPGATNHLRASAYSEAGLVARSDDFTVTTGPLPDFFPTFTVTTRTPAADGFLLVTGVMPDMTHGFMVAIDRGGRPYWYMSGGATANGNILKQLPGGTYTICAEGGFVEKDLFRSTLRRWISPAITAINSHDAHLDGVRAVLFGYGDLPDGMRAMMLDEVEELDEGGAVRFHWESEPFRRDSGDTYHPNSVDRTPDGGYVLSLANTREVIKVWASGGIAWRLGGSASTLRFVGDALGGIAGQHSVRWVGERDLIVFDNGHAHRPPESRAVQYRIDETARTATLVWQYRHTPAVYAFFGGGCHRRPGGSTIVSWMTGRLLTEVDPRGTVLWEAQSTMWLYHTEPADSLYPSFDPPPL